METEKLQETHQKYFCKICDYNTIRQQDYNRHLMTSKHQNSAKKNTLDTLGNQEVAKNAPNFYCEKCNYSCTNKSNYSKHLITEKHLSSIDNTISNVEEVCQEKKKYECDICSKDFINNSGLWKHKKKCKLLDKEVTIDLVLDLIKQNKELQNVLIQSNNKIIELSQNPSTVNNTTNNNTTNNTMNQQFNLNVFLNETCKDAMNITDFVNSLQLTTKDFENTGKVGFIEGITQIIINRINSVDTTKRPMHCTDAKRETVYIKDDNVWEKEDDKKTKLRKVVNQVANKNLQQIIKWKEEHPDFVTLDSQDNIDFRKYYRAALGGGTNEEDEKFFEKIKRNVLKEIVVNKST